MENFPPHVSINDAGTAVGLHQPFFASTTIHYQVGIINRDEVDFSESRLAGKDGIQKWQSTMKIKSFKCTKEDLSDGSIYYNVGVVDNFRISWGQHSQYVCWGRFSAVAVHDNRAVAMGRGWIRMLKE